MSGSNVYAAPNLDLLWKDDFSLMEFPKENLKFLEKLGEGQFGEVEAHQSAFFYFITIQYKNYLFANKLKRQKNMREFLR